MSAVTKIEWCDSTHNEWIGCTPVSPACEHCYAAISTPARVLGVSWGPGAPRRRNSDATRRLPLRWNRERFHECSVCGWRGSAKFADPVCCDTPAKPARRRVFGDSLNDWLDNEVPAEWLRDYLDLIRLTPNLDWLLLSKRIGNWRGRLQAARATISGCGESIALGDWIDSWLNGIPPANVRVGSTICNQAEADRDISKLLRVPAAARFLSIEPMLGPINFRWKPYSHQALGLTDREYLERYGAVSHLESLLKIDEVIVGGESGPRARPMHPDWPRTLRDQCAEAGVAFTFKQWGEWAPWSAQGKPDAVVLNDGRVLAANRQDPVPMFRPVVMARVGKQAAGRLLDGVTHDGFSQVRHG